jgi:hypothetical protein
LCNIAVFIVELNQYGGDEDKTGGGADDDADDSRFRHLR